MIRKLEEVEKKVRVGMEEGFADRPLRTAPEKHTREVTPSHLHPFPELVCVRLRAEDPFCSLICSCKSWDVSGRLTKWE